LIQVASKDIWLGIVHLLLVKAVVSKFASIADKLVM